MVPVNFRMLLQLCIVETSDSVNPWRLSLLLLIRFYLDCYQVAADCLMEITWPVAPATRDQHIPPSRYRTQSRILKTCAHPPQPPPLSWDRVQQQQQQRPRRPLRSSWHRITWKYRCRAIPTCWAQMYWTRDGVSRDLKKRKWRRL